MMRISTGIRDNYREAATRACESSERKEDERKGNGRRLFRERGRSASALDLRVVFIDISGGVCTPRACVRAVVNPPGLGGRSAECTEGDRYCGHLLELRLAAPARIFNPSVVFFVFSLRPSPSPPPLLSPPPAPAGRCATPTRSLGDFRHDLAPRWIFY